jgi:hypothetical protein
LDGIVQQDLKGIRAQLEDWKIGIDRQVLELTESIKRDILEEVAGDYVNLDIEDCKIAEPVPVAKDVKWFQGTQVLRSMEEAAWILS